MKPIRRKSIALENLNRLLNNTPPLESRNGCNWSPYNKSRKSSGSWCPPPKFVLDDKKRSCCTF
jgi:hypothetical protein